MLKDIELTEAEKTLVVSLINRVFNIGVVVDLSNLDLVTISTQEILDGITSNYDKLSAKGKELADSVVVKLAEALEDEYVQEIMQQKEDLGIEVMELDISKVQIIN